jgi:stalled ribosome rescue protein Dom34
MMATTEEIQNDRGKEEKDIHVQHLLHDIREEMNTIGSKMDTTNILLRELIKVCGVNSENNYEGTFVKSIYPENNSMYYHSPTETIQQGINELVLQKEADKIKQNMKVEWTRTPKL